MGLEIGLLLICVKIAVLVINTKVRCQTKKTILFGNYSQHGGGVFPNPKTFVNLPSIFCMPNSF